MTETLSRGVLVVTDLDGTLLDDTYDLEAAAQAMDCFTNQDHAVIPASSKTLHEVHQLNQLRASLSPVIFENGAGVAFPNPSNGSDLPYRFESSGLAYPELCATLDALRSSLNLSFEGFHDLSEQAVAKYTGLSHAASALAKQRLFSEPLRWLGTDEEQQIFRQHLQELELQLVSGGRFHHVMPMTNKGIAAASISAAYAANGTKPRWRIACGDSENDLPLLRWADAFVLFPNRLNEYMELHGERFILAKTAGKNEWINGVSTLIKTLTKQSMDDSHE